MCPGDWRMVSAMESFKIHLEKVMVIYRVLLVKLPIVNLARINTPTCQFNTMYLMPL